MSMTGNASPHLDAHAVRDALRGTEAEIVERFRGPPNKAMSSRKQLRWGSKGSFALVIDGPKAGCWFDHELGCGGDIIELIRQEQRCSFPDALAIATEFMRGPLPNVPTLRIVRAKPDADADDPDELKRIDQALDIWADVEPIRRTVVELYLVARGLTVPDAGIPDIGFHPRCPWGPGDRRPAMVALCRDIITGEPSGIHRTALNPDGTKIGRKVLGPKKGTAIKLSPEAQITDELTIGEGIETTISGMDFGFGPAWSMIDAGGLRGFPVLPHISRLTILVDNDTSGAGQAAAAACKATWETAGKRVRRVMPPEPGTDLNDALLARGIAQ